MKFGKLSLGAIVGCMAFVNPASAGVAAVVNICEVKPDGSVHTVRVSTLGSRSFKYYFKNVPLQHTFVLMDSVIASSRTFALNPGTYALKYSESAGNNPPQATYPHTIVLRPYTLTSGRGTGCVLNVPVTGVGSKAERVPTTPLPQ